jgi:wobble nucleotide-excising tRNase
MSSLDEHRSLATINAVVDLSTRSKQVIVLSHSKPFLCSCMMKQTDQLGVLQKLH